MTNTYWNAEVYDRIGKPMRRWAQQVIDDLKLTGDETVLDAGCGSGSVTFDLLERNCRAARSTPSTRRPR